MNKRTIVLLRHGEAEVSSFSGSDHDRKLTSAGCQQIESVAKSLGVSKFLPQVVFTSDARRTLETTEVYCRSANISPKILQNSKLYNANENIFFDCLYQLDQTINSVLLVGHNPVWTELINILSRQYTSMSPGCAAVLEIEAESWTELGALWVLVDVHNN